MKKISFNKFNKWVKSCKNQILTEFAFFDEEEEFKKEGVLFNEGELTVSELQINPCVVINGNLKIETFNWQFELGLLVVNGDLHCETFNFPFQTVITGNLIAETIDVDSGCDFGIYVGGNIEATTIIERGHSILAYGKIQANKVFSFHVVQDKYKTYSRCNYDDLPIVEVKNINTTDNTINSWNYIDTMIVDYWLAGFSEKYIKKEAMLTFDYNKVTITDAILEELEGKLKSKKPSVVVIENALIKNAKESVRSLTKLMAESTVWEFLTKTSNFFKNISNPDIDKDALEIKIKEAIHKFYK